MSNPFTEHPKEVGLSYTGHFVFAWSVVFKLVKAVFCCSIHSVFPFMFTHTTSTIVKHLHDKIEHRKTTH
jgi:hypothetical protein